MIIINIQPTNFIPEISTIWDFPERGSWCTHKGDYRGNFSPYVPRNIIMKYSQKYDTVLDQFCGSGTTLIEAKLLSRHSIGVDINKTAIDISKKNLDFKYDNETSHTLIQGSALDLSQIESYSIDLICTHPPYANIINYSPSISGDLSLLSLDEFIQAMKLVSAEAFRVLKHTKYLAFLIGDIRVNKCVYPLGFMMMNIFANTGFTLKEIVIKKQNNCKGNDYWSQKIRFTDYYLLQHEYLFIFKKP